MILASPDSSKKENRRVFPGFFDSTESVLFRGESDAKYKTEMCRNWESGNCEYGDKCFFAHGQKDLRGKNPTKPVKVQKCENFFKLGYCINGSKCMNRHTEDGLDAMGNNGKKNSPRGFSEKLNAPAFIDLESRLFRS